MTDPDRVLPHNLEAERAVLGAVLLDERALFGASEVLLEADFYLESHRLIYRAMLALSDESRPIDMTTLSAELRRAGTMEQAGGIAYVASLTDGLPRATNVGHYARLVKEASDLRRLIRAANQTVERAFEAQDRASAIVADLEPVVFDLAGGDRRDGFKPASTYIDEAIREIDFACQNKRVVTGIPTGIGELDRMTGGLQRGDMIVLAARPGMGKTSLALQVACHAAINHKARVGIMSIEMSGVSICKQRMLCNLAQVEAHRLRSGYMTREDWARINEARAHLSGARIWIDDAAGLTSLQARARARRLALEHGLDLLVIDYLQLMVSGARSENRNQEVTAISRSIKALARETNAPVLVLSQLNRASVKGEKARRPQLSDLRESGAIEQDADLVLFLHREEVEGEGDSKQDPVTVLAIVGKQRNGPPGDFDLVFYRSQTRFAELQR